MENNYTTEEIIEILKEGILQSSRVDLCELVKMISLGNQLGFKELCKLLIEQKVIIPM